MTTLLESLLFSNVFDPMSKDEKEALETLEKIAEMKHYKAIETRPFKDIGVRKKFVELAKWNSWNITYWLTSDMNKEHKNLSSIDETIRLSSVEFVKELIQTCVDGGASYIGLGSGQVSNNRESSFQAFLSSIKELLIFIKSYPTVTLLFEPLDMNAHKKNTIGDLALTKRLINDLKSNEDLSQFNICIDTAHFALNNDELGIVVQELAQYSNRIHFANAYLDPNDERFGDNHLPFGKPGILDDNKIKEMISIIKNTKFKEPIVYITAEVRSKTYEEAWENEKVTYGLLSKLM